MAPPFLVFENRDALMAAAAERIALALSAGIETRGRACAALSGGATPEPAYKVLAQQKCDWRRVTFALVDERFAPPGDPASNEGMLRRALAPALSNGAQVLPMWSDASPEDAAARANSVYQDLHFDIAVMGMGADGHTASWFPNAPNLKEALDLANVRSVMTLQSASAAGKTERLTMTLSALKRAQRMVLLITGAEKRAVYEQSLTSIAPSPVGALIAACGGRFETLWSP